MTAAIVDFDYRENEDFISPLITIQNSDGTARNLTGAALRFQVRPCTGAPGSPVLDLSIGEGIAVINAAGGVIQISIDRFAVPAGDYKQDLVEERSDLRTAIFAGAFNVLGGVTRWS